MSCITVTFGDRAENHKGMQIIGTENSKGFSTNDLNEFKKKFESDGLVCELVDLTFHLPDAKIANDVNEMGGAKVLVVRNCVDKLLVNSNSALLFDELKNLNWDKKALMYGRVVNKHARHNLCFGDFNQEPDYANGRGRIVSWEHIPLLFQIKYNLANLIGNSASDINNLVGLVGEGNYYYDVTKCGIGYHIDAERSKVIGIRLGTSPMSIHYQWVQKNVDKSESVIGTNCQIILNPGDLYVMSEIAKGIGFNKKNKYAVKHSAGCAKYTSI